MGNVTDLRPARWRAFFEAAKAVGEQGHGGERLKKLAETVRLAKAVSAPPLKSTRDRQIYCSAQWAAEAYIASASPMRAALRSALLGLGSAGLLQLDGPPDPPGAAAAQPVQARFGWMDRQDTGTD